MMLDRMLDRMLDWMGSGIERASRALLRLRHAAVLGVAFMILPCADHRASAQEIEGFAWTDLHGETERVQAVVKALEGEKYTALREIAVVGDEALVVTASRSNSTARPDQDGYAVYSVGLKQGSGAKDESAGPVRLMTGTHLVFRDWLRFVREGETELVATYDDCSDCRATTFLTAFYLDRKTKKWRARWPREVAGAPLISAAPVPATTGFRTPSGETDQAYALMMDSEGRAVLATWTHFHSNRRQKRAAGEDYLYAYDVDPASGLERSRLVAGTEAARLKDQLCRAEGDLLHLAAGQDTASCRQILRTGAGRAATPSRRRRVFTKPLVGESRPH